MCRLTGTEPSILLHPLDFIGQDDTKDLSFFPAMRVDSGLKIEVMHGMFNLLKKHYQLTTMQGHFESASKSTDMRQMSIA